MLIQEEDWRNKPYRCTAGYLTIGVGCNLDTNGLCDSAILEQLRYDIIQSRASAEKICTGFWDSLNDVRQDVLTAMVFQIGAVGVSKFKATLQALRTGNYDLASQQMLNSKWAKQTPARAKRMAKLIKYGEYNND
jgi:lysozyme